MEQNNIAKMITKNILSYAEDKDNNINEKLQQLETAIRDDFNLQMKEFKEFIFTKIEREYVKRKPCKFGRMCNNFYDPPYFKCKYKHSNEEYELRDQMLDRRDQAILNYIEDMGIEDETY